MSKVQRSCDTCGSAFSAEVAEVNRGWGRFCSRACKVSAQIGGSHPNAKRPPEPPMRAKIEQRTQMDANGGCWLWEGRLSSHGYGRIESGKRAFGAHRVSYETFVGPIPDGLLVCHRCDIPACVNPDHLFLGTCKDNTTDMMRKGRHRNGLRPKRSERARNSEPQIALTAKALRYLAGGEG